MTKIRAVYSCVPPFQRNVLPPYSWWKEVYHDPAAVYVSPCSLLGARFSICPTYCVFLLVSAMRYCTGFSAFSLSTYTGLFISPSGISELDCATTKRDTAERTISIGRESLQVFFFVLEVLAYFQVPPLGGSREEKWRSQ